MNTLTVQRFTLFFLGVFTLLSGTVVGAAAQVTILVNPGPFTSVKEAARSEEKVNWWDDDLSDDRACTECFAALELSCFLTACTTLREDEISLHSPDKLPLQGDVFLVGSRQSNPLITSCVLPKGDELKTDESFQLQAIQEENRTITIIEGKDRVGTLYGVYCYLEQLGIRFYGLGEKGTVYPSKQAELRRNLNLIENPSFLTRGFWARQERGNEEFFLWMARNRMNFWTAEEKKKIHFLKKLGMKLTAGGHIIQEYFLSPHAEYPYDYPKFHGDEDKPKDPYAPGDEYVGDTNGDGKLTYFEAHPEWYASRGSKRSNHIRIQGDNYCTSNADATKELAKNLVQCLVDGRWHYVDIVNFWTLDGGQWCECDNCKRQGTYTDRLLDVVYRMLTEIRNARQQKCLQRNVQLSTLAYHETLSPPTSPLPDDFDYENFSVTFFPIQRCYVHALADPSCTETNQHLLKNYQGWVMGSGRFYTGAMCIGEYYNVSSIRSLPVLFPRIMAADIPWYYSTGARHFHYMHTPTDLWGTWTLNQYLLGRLLWYTDTNVDVLLDGYFHRYYPTTTERTQAFYQHLEVATANIKAFKHNVWFRGQRWRLLDRLKYVRSELFPLEHLRYDPYHPALDDGPDVVEIVEAMRLARREIDAALIMCSDKIEQARLLEDERRFAYGEAMIYFYYHLVRTGIFHRRGDEIMARHEFLYVEEFAKQLRGITDLVQVSYYNPDCKDGFDASQAEDVYKFFKKKYGN